MYGNLASTCHQTPTVFATVLMGTGKTLEILRFLRVLKKMSDLAQSLLNQLQPTNGPRGLEK